MNKSLKNELMQVPQRPAFDMESLETLRPSAMPLVRRVVAVAAMLFLTLGVLLWTPHKVSEPQTYTAAEEVGEELIIMVDYFNGDDVDEECNSYALSTEY